MTRMVELPLWLLVLFLLFAAVTASTHLLFPSVRWFLRRRAERLVAEINKRLDHPIQPFKLLRRQDMIRRVIYDPEVVRAAGDYAHERGLREDVGFEKAWDYAREIVPAFSATAYFGVAIRVARWFATWLFEVRLHHADEAALGAIDPGATVVYVMNHRSNFDYVLVTYLAARRSALSYAVGEWARVWPLSHLIRAMGAYFIRRRARTALYRKVLATYVRRATEAGVTQAVFPEGALSRTGELGQPRLGILAYIAEGWREGGRDVVFVPVSLNYDRVVEDRVLVAAGRSGSRVFRASVPEGVRFGVRYACRRLAGRVGKFGVAAVTFGRPVSLAAIAREGPGDLVEALAMRLFAEIRAGMPVTLVPLALLALEGLGRPSTEAEIAEAMATRHAPVPEGDLEQVLELLVLRRILVRDGDRYAIADLDLASFYANSVRTHVSAPAPDIVGTQDTDPT